MIRIGIAEDVRPGMYIATAASHRLSIKSRQPLLDTCRELKRMGIDTSSVCGLFRKGRDEPDLMCAVGVGAGLTVCESNSDGPHLMKYKPFERAFLLEAAE